MANRKALLLNMFDLLSKIYLNTVYIEIFAPFYSCPFHPYYQQAKLRPDESNVSNYLSSKTIVSGRIRDEATCKLCASEKSLWRILHKAKITLYIIGNNI